MKLSKKNAARQRVLQKAIASGKTLGGLLVGLAATVTGYGRHPPASIMGRSPNPNYQENATNENAEVLVAEGGIPEQKPPTPNAVRERRGKEIVPGKPLTTPPPRLPPGQYRVKYGDSLSKIAKTHGTTVAELKRLNGFDDMRADNLIAGEIIKVPQPKRNTVNEVKGGRRLPLLGVPLPPKPRETLQK
jgi:LysM repeat protein